MPIRESPWGAVQHEAEIAPGITQVSTASHGGIFITPERNARVHGAWRRKGGWYEEDCDWAIVAITFPEHFQEPMPEGSKHTGQTHAEYARTVLWDWLPDEYAKVFGTKVPATESYTLRRRALAAGVMNDLRVASAWGPNGDGHGRTRVPDGWLGVMARKGGRFGANGQHHEWHLVPAADYDEADEAGVVVDPARHPVWPELATEEVDQPVVVSIGQVGPSMLGAGQRWVPAAKNTFRLVASAAPHRGVEVGELWRYPAAGSEPESWRALRRRGRPGGASIETYPTREAALEAVGFMLAPYAEVPDGEDDGEGDDEFADVAAFFAQVLAPA